MAAEAIAGAAGGLGIDVLDRVSSLLDASLVRRVDGPEDEPRFGMLETIREYALERLAERGEEHEASRRHAACCIALAEQTMAATRSDSQDESSTTARRSPTWWLDRLEAEHANLRAALAWLERTGEAAATLRLAAALWPFWLNRSHRQQGCGWLERLLARSEEAPPSLRAEALTGLGATASARGDDARAVAPLEAALVLWRELGDATNTGYVLLLLGVVALHRGDYDRAVILLEEALAHLRDPADWFFIWQFVTTSGSCPTDGATSRRPRSCSGRRQR